MIYSPLMLKSQDLFISDRKLSFNSKIPFIMLLVLLFSLTPCLAQIFEDRGTGIEQWDILDWRGDARIYPTTDQTCPPGYGPGVLHIEGGVVLGMVKGQKMSEGTF